MSQVIGAELHLETVGGETIRDRHDTGVVAQDVQRLMAQMERVGESPDRREARKIERHHFHVSSRRRRDYLRGGGPRFAEIAACENHLCPLAREFERGFVSDSTVAASYNYRLAGQIGDVVAGPGF